MENIFVVFTYMERDELMELNRKGSPQILKAINALKLLNCCHSDSLRTRISENVAEVL